MALISIGQKVSMQLRDGRWIRDTTVVSILGNLVVVQAADGSFTNADMNKDVVVMSITSGTDVL